MRSSRQRKALLAARKLGASNDSSAGRACALPPVDRWIDAPPVALQLPVDYRRLSEVQEKPIRWLWPGRFAGQGHSDRGQWPVDRCPCAPGNVVVLSAEDDDADTIKPRCCA
jgi:hypothetical protein